jgi:hypothetical protein
MKKCCILDYIADRLYRSTFRIYESPQGFGGGHRGGRDFIGERNGRKGPTRCYNFNEKGYIARDFPLSRCPWCSHYRNNTHAIKDFPEFIMKWEDSARKRGANLINYDSRPVTEEKEPNINIITRGGTRTGVDVENSTQ